MSPRKPLSAEEMYPAGVAGVSTRMLRLATGVTVRVAEAGPRDGIPVLCVHGWGASLYLFRHALELLPDRGCRVVVPDLRGFGLSEKPTERGAYATEALCSDIGALLDALSVDRAAVVGQSMGGGL